TWAMLLQGTIRSVLLEPFRKATTRRLWTTFAWPKAQQAIYSLPLMAFLGRGAFLSTITRHCKPRLLLLAFLALAEWLSTASAICLWQLTPATTYVTRRL